MKPIRVLHVFGWLESGGAESRTMDIYRSINKEKVQFDFLIHTNEVGFYEEEIKKMGGRIYRLPRFNFKNYFRYKNALKRFFKKHPEYNIIHGHMLSTAFIYLKVAKQMGVPVRIAHSRSGNRAQKNPISIAKNLTDKLSRFDATNKFAVSKIAALGAFGKTNLNKNNVKVIPNAIDAKKFSYSEVTRISKRKEFNLNDAFVIGHIGRFTEQKNHLFLLEVFNSIKNIKKNAKMILIGDGPLHSNIENRIVELDLVNDIFMLGIRDDIPNLLQIMDIFVFPSTHEGLPGVILESQASGLPCLISNSITKEVQLTNLVEYKSIQDTPSEWAKSAIKKASQDTRRNTFDIFVDQGYDIKSISKFYQDFYLNPFIEDNETK